MRTNAPSGDPTGGLKRYPEDLLNSPLDRRSASFRVQPGDGSLVAPRAEGERTVTTRDASGQGFAGLFDDAAAGKGVLLLLLLAALGWGALHALSPGHGKAMVAAYLIGTRGTARHAVGLGVTVTVTHTLGVFALGLVTLLLSQYILPEDLYPWLTLVSGLLVVGIGAGVLRSRIRWARARRAGTASGPGPSAEAALHSHGPGGHSHGPGGHHHSPLTPPRPRPHGHPPQPDRHGRGRGTDPLPLGARGAAGGDRSARGGARPAADRRLQRRPRRHSDRPGATRGLRAQASAARSEWTAGSPAPCPPRRRL